MGYTYRADGLMASRAKTIYVQMFGQWQPVTQQPTYYLRDGGEPVLEMDLGTNYSTVVATNVRGPDGLVARRQGGSWVYYDFDAQGSVSQRLDASGNVLSSSVYDAYGAETSSGTPTDPFGYNAQWGYWLDRDTGLYLCQARWYDPVTVRWVTRDPIGYAGGANLYGYCGGGPVGSADPWGLARTDLAAGASLMGREGAKAWLDKIPGWLRWLANLGTKATRGAAAGVGAGALASMAGDVPIEGTAAVPCEATPTKDKDNPPWVRVGRWMGEGEYTMMQATGRVQASLGSMGDSTWPTMPPNPAAYKPQSPDEGFAEFDVPRSHVFSAGKPGWVHIGGGGFWRGRRAGLPIGMPPFASLGPWEQSP